MIKHIVSWQLKNEFDGKNKSEIAIFLKQILLDMAKEIAEIENFSVGINIESEISNYDLVIVVDFKCFDDLKTYSSHPAHLKVVEILKNYRTNRACVDYEY